MSEIEPLFALLEVMLNLSAPRMKPGGHSEDIFVELTEAEKEQYECAICYQILKDPRHCVNKHHFCYPCIFVWSTSGSPVNHSRCPVCRVEGMYLRSRDLDEKLSKKKVKCTMKTCRWTGSLKQLGAHQHTTYSRQARTETENSRVSDLPRLPNGRLTGADPTGQLPVSTSRTTVPNSTARQTQAANTSGVPRTSSNRSSPYNAEPAATSALTNRTPRPPSQPRPPGMPHRRVPALPTISNQNRSRGSQTETRRLANAGTNASNGNSQTENRRSPNTSASTQTGSGRSTGNNNTNGNGGYQTIRDRLLESRTRLDTLMTIFTGELERGRRDIVDFQEERERRRQEQLDEVRDLGNRLSTVAGELRRLLSERRQIRDELEEISES